MSKKLKKQSIEGENMSDLDDEEDDEEIREEKEFEHKNPRPRKKQRRLQNEHKWVKYSMYQNLMISRNYSF